MGYLNRYLVHCPPPFQRKVGGGGGGTLFLAFREAWCVVPNF